MPPCMLHVINKDKKYGQNNDGKRWTLYSIQSALENLDIDVK